MRRGVTDIALTDRDPRAVALVNAIQKGDVQQLEELLRQDPALGAARIVDDKLVRRSLLHIVTDWPGHFPKGRVRWRFSFVTAPTSTRR